MTATQKEIDKALKQQRKQKSKAAKQFVSLADAAPQGARVTNLGPELTGLDGVLGHYAAASVAPFSAAAVGARVPAPYEARTITAKLHTVFNPVPNVQGAYGFSCVLTASPIATVLSHSRTLSAIDGGVNCNVQVLNANPAVVDPASVLANRWVNVTGNDWSRGATTAANLAKLFGQYRVVSCGFRVRVESSFTATSGRLLVARAPAGPVVPLTSSSYWGATGVPNEEDDADILKSFYAANGFPWSPDSDANAQFVTGDIAASILSFPDSLEVSLPSILETGYEFICPKTSALHTQFIHAQATGEYSVGEQSIVGTRMDVSGPDAAPGDSSLVGTPPSDPGGGFAATVPRLSDNSTAGFTNIALKFVGLGAETRVSIETIYHLEGTPAVYDATDPNMPIPTSMKAARASSMHVDEVNSLAGTMPMGRPAGDDTAAHHMMDAVQGAGSALSSRVGSAMRNAGASLLGMIPGGGVLRSAGGLLNTLTGGHLGNAAKSMAGNVASAVKARFASLFGR